ncbi:YceI family protein [Flavobacterium pedocola]
MKRAVLTLLVISTMTFVSCNKQEKAIEEPLPSTSEAVITQGDLKLTVDTKSSVINWIGAKPTGKHHGTINLKEGEVMVKEGNIQSGTFILDMNTLTVTDLKAADGKADLEAHLKGTKGKDAEDDFFNVKRYPTGKFVIQKVAHEDGKTIVYGSLTLKNVVKAVNFPATVVATDSLVSIESEPLMINRTYWNINYGSKTVFNNLKDKFINDEVEVQIKVKATK